MSQKIINTGQADKGNGDPIRTAFTKVNDNFTELYSHLSAGVVIDNNPPDAPGEGDLWWDPVSGRLYISYDTNWVDASPVDGTGISSTNELVNGASSFSVSSDGTLSLPDFGATPGSGDGVVGDICRNGDTLYFKTGAGWAAIGMTLI